MEIKKADRLERGDIAFGKQIKKIRMNTDRTKIKIIFIDESFRIVKVDQEIFVLGK